MKTKFFSLIYILFLGYGFVLAGPGDTIEVQTFTFGSPQDAWFVFPSDTVRLEKILMKYTLKCNPSQSPACGEWDYLTYTYLYDHTGGLDSSLVNQPTYTINGASTPVNFSFMNTPSYSYSPSWQYYMNHTDTLSLDSFLIGSGMISASHPLGASNPVSRSQYLWKASEMNASGITAGNITGLKIFLQALGGELRNLKIRFKATTVDSLHQSNFSDAGFTTVYLQNTTFTTTGWNALSFTNPFNWNGTSNVIIEITYDNNSPSTDNVVLSSNTTYNSALINAGNDRVAEFHSYGHVQVPLNQELIELDSAVTVALWCYGNPALQPMDGTAFEAVDSLGNRILNSHLPWSDNNVYWDAGFEGTGYDRINKPAAASQFEGQWNYWVFTKNVATGSMKIYVNGVLFHSGTGKTKPLSGIKYFRIGKGNWNGSQTYEGKIDEFAVFNTELSATTILDNMSSVISPSHPAYSNLVLYYKFDDGNYSTFTDNAPAAHLPASIISVNNPLRNSSELINHFTISTSRPDLYFDQGVFTSGLDSNLVVDSIINNPVTIISYTDSINNPGVAIDTMVVWPTYYNQYVYNSSGIAIDSTFVPADDSIHIEMYDWYNTFPEVNRYELARYITPYGIGLSLGTGWTWTFDLSDYRTLLADSVHLSAGNWQELLDVKFLLIEGTPPRDVVSIQNLWNGSFNFGQPSDPIESHLTPMNVSIPNNALNTRWKSRVTGHGMDTPQNCAEFCPKTHYYKVNNTQQFSQLVWRDNCDVNPLYPQGGTWVYDRANWCPGAEVWTYDFELTSLVTPGSTFSLDHDVQTYTNNGEWSYYQIEDQLVTYGAPNFTLDAAIVDIISPSKDQMHLRHNPICTEPLIVIRNTGSTNLTSLTITYGLNGAIPSVYNWTGNLKFMESTTVELGTFNWAQGASDFTVTLSNPNGGSDQYSFNNSMTSEFTYPLLMPSRFVIEFKTNNFPSENQYTLKDQAGTVIHSRNGASLSANTFYRDTLELMDGCYVFELTDAGEDGLSFWANTSQGSGNLRFRNSFNTSLIKNFGTDFGGQIYQQFTVGLTSSVDENISNSSPGMNVYPNPNDGAFYIDFDLNGSNDGVIEIFDMLGHVIRNYKVSELDNNVIRENISSYSDGIYFVTLRVGSQSISKKVVISK